MPFVLDASAAANWALRDETSHPVADAAFNQLRDERAHVPALWWFEIRNTLAMAERRGRILESGVAEFLRRLDDLPIAADYEPDSAAMFILIRRHRLTAYDAAYLELAQRLDVPLATLDTTLANAAQQAGIKLVG